MTEYQEMSNIWRKVNQDVAIVTDVSQAVAVTGAICSRQGLKEIFETNQDAIMANLCPSEEK